MARKNTELNRVSCCKPRLPKASSPKSFKVIGSPSPSPFKGVVGRNSPSNNTSCIDKSPRTSPGLTAGHYAGLKFSEPPSPSSLPKPPQHWMQASHNAICSFADRTYHQHMDIAHQLKVLLKVQA